MKTDLGNQRTGPTPCFMGNPTQKRVFWGIVASVLIWGSQGLMTGMMAQPNSPFQPNAMTPSSSQIPKGWQYQQQAYLRYSQQLDPLIQAMDQAETFLTQPESVTVQRWSAWLQGWDAHMAPLLTPAQETQWNSHQSYQQLRQLHTQLHELSPLLQQQYLGLVATPEAAERVEAHRQGLLQQLHTCQQATQLLQLLKRP